MNPLHSPYRSRTSVIRRQHRLTAGAAGLPSQPRTPVRDPLPTDPSRALPGANVIDLTADACPVPDLIPGDLALTAEERADAVATWLGRMHNEHVSARVFAALIPQLMRAGIHDRRLSEVAAMIDEELTHARLCAGVVVALGGRPVVDLGALPDVPDHADAPPLEGLLRNVLSISCLSETVAVAQVTAERERAGSRALERVLARILADEVGHARFGWRLLDALAPTLDAAMRERLGDYLIVAFASLIAYQHATGGDPGHVPTSSAQAVGMCHGALQRGIFADTVATAIIPGLEAHGLGAAAAWAAACRVQAA